MPARSMPPAGCRRRTTVPLTRARRKSRKGFCRSEITRSKSPWQSEKNFPSLICIFLIRFQGTHPRRHQPTTPAVPLLSARYSGVVTSSVVAAPARLPGGAGGSRLTARTPAQQFDRSVRVGLNRHAVPAGVTRRKKSDCLVAEFWPATLQGGYLLADGRWGSRTRARGDTHFGVVRRHNNWGSFDDRLLDLKYIFWKIHIDACDCLAECL